MNLFQCVPAVSPNGKMIAFCGRSIWIRSLDSTDLRELVGTDGALSVIWSPDSSQLAFYQTKQLKRISAAGGASEKICDATDGSGGCWNSHGVILFQNGHNGPLFQVPATGGTPTPVTTLKDGQTAHVRPTFLPDEQTYLYAAASSNPESQGIFAARLGSTDLRRVSPVLSIAGFSRTGHLLFVQRGNLMAQKFDPSRLALEGTAIQVAANTWAGLGWGVLDISPNGVLVYPENNFLDSQLTWFDRSGHSLGTLGPVGPFIHVALSRDDRLVLAERLEPGGGSIWGMDPARGIPTPIASERDKWFYLGTWSPDASRIFCVMREADNRIYLVLVSAGTGLPEKLFPGQEGLAGANDWSADGKYLLFGSADASTNTTYLKLADVSSGPSRPGEYEVQEYLSGRFRLAQAQFSPDGRWVAYVSDETGMPEIYVSPFPNPTAKWRISKDGGYQPRWRRDSRELFFVVPNDRMLMSARVANMPDQADVPMPLFRLDPVGYGGRTDYAVSADGRRFLVNTRVGQVRPTTLQVIVGWKPEEV